MEAFRNLILKDLQQVVPKKNINSRHIQEGIEQLEKINNIVVWLADKIGGVVIMDKSFYNSQLDKMLSDENTYVKLSSVPTSAYQKDLQRLVDLGSDKGSVHKKEKKINT